MAFLSELMDRPVTDVDGQAVGRVDDVIARFWADLRHPVIQAIVVKHKDRRLTIPFSAIAALLAPTVPLNCRAGDAPAYPAHEDDVYLVRDVLDKQIIDTDGARVVRVNDLELVRVNGTILVSNVDIGLMGILRRVGLAGAFHSLTTRLRLPQPHSIISWDDVELLRHDQFMRLRVPGEKIQDLHPADVAEIISDLNRVESGEFLETLDVEHLADALEEVEPEFQASLVKTMSDEKVADVLEEMEPDEAADLLAELPKERSAGLLKLMEQDEADDVRKLLAYPEDSAGGIMTTEYASIPPNLTAEQAIQALRETARDATTILYVYVVDAVEHLLGVFSLSKLILVGPDTPVADFMQKRMVTVGPLDAQEDVAQLVAKYNLLAVPVVDADNRLHGIVTSDDALDKIIPTAWKKRLPRFYH